MRRRSIKKLQALQGKISEVAKSQAHIQPG